MTNTSKQLTEYNGIVKENNELYRNIAKELGLADSTFWILYTLRENNGTTTQRDIVNANFLPPQTINSALKKLESDGYVEMKSACDKRKKQVVLTENGKTLAAQTVDRVIALEVASMEVFAEQEKELFLELFRKYTDALQTNLSKIEGVCNGE